MITLHGYPIKVGDKVFSLETLKFETVTEITPTIAYPITYPIKVGARTYTISGKQTTYDDLADIYWQEPDFTTAKIKPKRKVYKRKYLYSNEDCDILLTTLKYEHWKDFANENGNVILMYAIEESSD